MKKINVLLFGTIMALTLTFAPIKANATSLASGRASIDGISVDGDFFVEWSPWGENYIEGYANNTDTDDYDFDAGPAPSYEASADASVPYAEVYGESSEEVLFVRGSASADLIMNESSSWIYAGTDGFFNDDGSGSGIFTVSIDYSIEQYMATDLADEYSDVFSEVWVSIVKTDEFGYSLDEETVKIEKYNFLEGDNYGFQDDYSSRSGTSSISMYFAEGEYGYVDIGTANESYAYAAPVPEPGTIMLFGFGLTGLIFYRKKTA